MEDGRILFFNDPATPVIYTRSLHDALPISVLYERQGARARARPRGARNSVAIPPSPPHRKRTPLNNSHDDSLFVAFRYLKKKPRLTSSYLPLYHEASKRDPGSRVFSQDPSAE